MAGNGSAGGVAVTVDIDQHLLGLGGCAVFGEDECLAVPAANDPELHGYLASMAQLAERRAQALPLDRDLLRELLKVEGI